MLSTWCHFWSLPWAPGWSRVCWVSPLKSLLFLFPYRKDITVCGPLVRVGSCFSSLTVDYLYLLLGIFLPGKFASLFIYSHLFIYSVMCRFMDIYFVLWNIIQYHLFCLQLWPLLFLLFLWYSPTSLWLYALLTDRARKYMCVCTKWFKCTYLEIVRM